MHYALTSANDAPSRDPRDWTLQGSQDGETWTTLDTQTDQEFPERFHTNEYRLENDTAYLWYRLDITRNWGAGIIQLAELQLSDGDTTPPPPTDMRAFVSGGPVNGWTMRPNAGWTGVRALQYSGGHISEDRAFAYNKVFDVDIPVTDATELSYVAFPELTANDLSYPSTHVAVDLAFDDGTYLSELEAEDHHGFDLNPQAQGASNSLWPDQWNHKRSRVGAVAAVDRVAAIAAAHDASDSRAPRVRRVPLALRSGTARHDPVRRRLAIPAARFDRTFPSEEGRMREAHDAQRTATGGAAVHPPLRARLHPDVDLVHDGHPHAAGQHGNEQCRVVDPVGPLGRHPECPVRPGSLLEVSGRHGRGG